MSDWFTIEQINADTYIISEYRHWEETHCYLLNGTEQSLLIDTGLGIANIYDEVCKLTKKPVAAVATHVHWDHIGGHQYFENFYAHSAELNWLQGGFPLPLQTIKNAVADRCNSPKGYNIHTYTLFQGTPTRILEEGDVIDLGGRCIEVLHTPGHAPGHMCFWEQEQRFLYTGDLVYKGTLTANFPSTDPSAYLASLKKIAELPVRRILPGHHTLQIAPEILFRMRDAFQICEAEGKLHHGSGLFDYGDWSVQF